MKKVFVTTSWDDGHKLDIRLSKVLNKFKIKATFYIAPRNQEFSKKEILNDNQIIKLSKSFEIGGHTMTHPTLTKLSSNEAESEIVKGKKYLELLISEPILSFCYPKGKYNPDIQKIVAKNGFKFARTVERFLFSKPHNQLAAGTTLHTYNQYQDLLKIAMFSNWKLNTFIKNMNWENLAIKAFDFVLKNGGIYHLWGHSWLIDSNNDWGKLERVLDHIAGRKNVTYLENRELVDLKT